MSVATQPPHVAMLGTEVLPIPPVLGGAVEQAVYEASLEVQKRYFMRALRAYCIFNVLPFSEGRSAVIRGP